jgi:hypothetical protein
MSQVTLRLQKRMRFLNEANYNGKKWKKVDSFYDGFQEIAYAQDPQHSGNR